MTENALVKSFHLFPTCAVSSTQNSPNPLTQFHSLPRTCVKSCDFTGHSQECNKINAETDKHHG